jgi:hypothetical protein
MTRAWCVLGLLGMVAATPSSATAGTISDPIIGVRGGKFGSPPIDSGQQVDFGACPAELNLKPSFTCIPYLITESFSEGISSVLLHIDNLADPDSALVFVNDPGSQFYLSDLGGGDILLSALPGVAAPLDFFDSHPVPPAFLQCPDPKGIGHHTCGVGEDLLLYISPILKGPNRSEGPFAFASTVEAVNGQPVPEPGTLLLMGTGVAALVSRRRRQKA